VIPKTPDGNSVSAPHEGVRHSSNEANKRRYFQVIAQRTKAWSLRFLVLAGIALLCWWCGSVIPAIGFALAWIPNYPLFVAIAVGALRLPRRLEPVHPIEPVLYRWVGVGLVKWLVTTRPRLVMMGFEWPQQAVSRQLRLERVV